MGRKRPERDQVEKLLKTNHGCKAGDIAEKVGLIETMGYDKAVDYVRNVRRSMKKAGAFPEDKYKFASDEARLEDINKLFEIRQGKVIDEDVASLMLMLNCYYRLRSEDDTIHWQAIDDTYAKNKSLVEPLSWNDAIKQCNVAMAGYMRSNDKQEQERARRKGFPSAGFCYASRTLIQKLCITDDELQHMKSIRLS